MYRHLTADFCVNLCSHCPLFKDSTPDHLHLHDEAPADVPASEDFGDSSPLTKLPVLNDDLALLSVAADQKHGLQILDTTPPSDP